MKNLYLLLFFIVTLSNFSQNEASKWNFGQYAALDFMTCPPSILSSSLSAHEGCSSIADSAGNLLFYTQGLTVYNKLNLVMPNSGGLIADISCTQAALIVKKPGSSTQYYIFTLGATTGLYYSIVDMSLAAGLGSVAVLNTPVYPQQCMEKLAATRHCNGIDIWIVIHEVGPNISTGSNKFRAYLLSSGGLSTVPIISSIGYSFSNNPGPNLWPGTLKFSPNGKKAGASLLNAGFELFDFDNSTGLFSNVLNFNLTPPVTTTGTGVVYDCEFSPDGSKLYAITLTNSTFFQWDLCAGSNAAILTSQYTFAIPTSTPYGNTFGMQRAPNGKIYINSYVQNYLGVINNPNSIGINCGYVAQGQSIGTGTCDLGLPNFVSSLVKSFLNYTVDLACSTVSFSPPATVYQGTAGCSNVVNTVTSYKWNFGHPSSGSANTSTLSNPVHTYTSFGNYPVKLVMTYASCAPDSIQEIIKINTPVLAINQITATCSGLPSATVNVSQGCNAGLYSYTWAPSAQSGSVGFNLSPGIHTVAIKVNGGTCISTITANITAPITISANISSTISCSTASAQITGLNGSGNYTYSWIPGNQTSYSVTGIAPGTYTVIITDIANQCSFSKTLQVTSYITPTLTVTGSLTICKGEKVNLIVSGANTYSWNTGAITPTISVNPTAYTTYSVTGTNTLGLCRATNTIGINVLPCTSVVEESQVDAKINFYPNPNASFVNIETDKDILLKIFDYSGALYKEQLIAKGLNSISIENLKVGIYFMIVFENNKNYTYKLIKN